MYVKSDEEKERTFLSSQKLVVNDFTTLHITQKRGYAPFVKLFKTLLRNIRIFIATTQNGQLN